MIGEDFSYLVKNELDLVMNIWNKLDQVGDWKKWKNWKKWKKWKKWGVVAGVLVFSFFAGRTVALVKDEVSQVHGNAEQAEETVQPNEAAKLASGDAGANWGLSFQEEGKAPIANASASYLKEFDAYYIEETQEKVIYLTFDCGFENGNTPAILDALKKHQAPATFFVVGNFLETSPDLVKRMVEEGHTVGNHTYHHPNMSKMTSVEAFSQELKELEDLYQETVGSPMPAYYRPPQGIYSESNLKMAQELGYQTIFWSLAYVDWNQDSQPTKEEAFDKLLNRIHPGAVVLLHNTSSTNGQIMDELLTKWEEMGYRFCPLSDLTGVEDQENAPEEPQEVMQEENQGEKAVHTQSEATRA